MEFRWSIIHSLDMSIFQILNRGIKRTLMVAYLPSLFKRCEHIYIV